jgi:hypothetical protein
MRRYFSTFGGIGVILAGTLVASLAVLGNDSKHPFVLKAPDISKLNSEHPGRLDPRLIQPTRIVQEGVSYGPSACLPSSTASPSCAHADLTLRDRPNMALVKLQAQMVSYLGLAPDLRRREVADSRTPPAD